MDILFILIPISFILAGGGLVACVWAIRDGQYNDVDSPGQKLVFEDMEHMTRNKKLLRKDDR